MAEVTETFTEHGDVPRRPPARPGVVQLHGPEGPCRRSWVFERELRIGREGDVEIRLDDAKVSRLHARIARTRGSWTLFDEGSRNGTFLDGHAIEGSKVLRPGSLLRVGRSLLMVVDDALPHAAGASGFDRRLIGGPGLAEVRRTIRRVAQAGLPCLVEGETGTGKERVAEAIHFATGRTGDLVATNCAALPPDLAESELFGHRQGAYSGATEDRAGLFSRAHRGTLFLDEVGELNPDLQAKLLRVLEDGRVRPVGSDRERSVDVQLVAATNRSLQGMVEQGTFRADLYHRIAVGRTLLPPLRARRDDIPALVDHFNEDRLKISCTAIENWMMRDWPGNIRELRSAVRMALSTARDDDESEVMPAHLPSPAPSSTSSSESFHRASSGPVADDERARIEEVLRRVDGNVSEACRVLGVSRSWFYEVIRRLRIEPGNFRPGSSE